MVSLIDIGPAKTKVQIRGQEFEVVGLAAQNIAEILLQFPELRRMLVQGSVGKDVIESLMMRIPDAVELLVAAACGVDVSDEKQREEALPKVKNFTLGEQYEVIEAMLGITFPRGINSFMAGIQGLFEQADGAGGRVPATRSPAQSNGASPQDETSENAGDRPLAS
jgi:hypothetical protein